MKGKIFIISGPSGSGKTTLYKKLLASRKDLVKSISVTTRPPRGGEKHGREYFFVSKKMFAYKKRCNHFLESEKVFDQYYGTPKKEIKRRLSARKSVLLCIDVKGAKTVKKHFPKAVGIFIKTKSLAVLKKRLMSRGSESKETARLRIQTAQKELKAAKNYDYTVVNDHLGTAFHALKVIVAKELSEN